ncbi:hypothetical protein EZX63_18615 [Salmonella enterica subsp. enterica serovar Oranienburg]|nr:hypothetical protein [Salmonella enterica]EBR8189846.1 hypothetical protein [Salmonella enterica subsp. enterica serovar Oranienburg]EBW4241187.1 hypothetical protein [Salmonella enterica subsp. enterica serovar Oranienburg]EBY7479920.1 hypothetical protein [Salmonella enterica subsp. enterica serovar Oranienburg]ECD3327788.1 hypothetical protein [Salmonella enterica subsp. enterica serovar Oranienburg]
MRRLLLLTYENFRVGAAMGINFPNFGILTGALFLVLTGYTYAGIQVSPMTINLDGQDDYSGSVSVYSTSTETQYIKVTVKKIIFPGTSQQKEIPVLPGDGEGLVVSPQRFVLSPQGKHIIRLLPLNVPQNESIYRVYVSSVPNENEVDKVDNNASITINVIWGALVYVKPKNSIISLSYDGNTGYLANHGNVHIRISDYGFCFSGKNCQWKKMARSIYPGMSLRISDKQDNKGGNLFIKYQEGQKTVVRKVD